MNCETQCPTIDNCAQYIKFGSPSININIARPPDESWRGTKCVTTNEAYGEIGNQQITCHKNYVNIEGYAALSFVYVQKSTGAYYKIAVATEANPVSGTYFEQNALILCVTFDARDSVNWSAVAIYDIGNQSPSVLQPPLFSVIEWPIESAIQSQVTWGYNGNTAATASSLQIPSDTTLCGNPIIVPTNIDYTFGYFPVSKFVFAIMPFFVWKANIQVLQY